MLQSYRFSGAFKFTTLTNIIFTIILVIHKLLTMNYLNYYIRRKSIGNT